MSSSVVEPYNSVLLSNLLLLFLLRVLSDICKYARSVKGDLGTRVLLQNYLSSVVDQSLEKTLIISEYRVCIFILATGFRNTLRSQSF